MCLVGPIFGKKKFQTSKFRTLISLAKTRSSKLHSRQKCQYLQAKHDVVELLKRGEHERALYHVHLVIKFGNMMEAFAMTQEYFHLLLQRVELIEMNEECPDELKEIISTLIFASSRIGDFPELHKIRRIIVSKYGKELATRVIELRKNCSVNSQIKQKLSDEQPSLKTKYKLLQQIATENDIDLHLENNPFTPMTKEKTEATQISNRKEKYKPAMCCDTNKGSYESPRARKKYRDAAEAAEDAFESAAFAAYASKAAVELSRAESADDYDRSDSSHGSNRRQHGPMYVMLMGR